LRQTFKTYKMQKLYCKLVLFLSLSLVISCSGDDSNGPDAINENGGEIFRSQVVTVDLHDTTVSQNEYTGMLDGAEVTLLRSDEHKLIFLVPSNSPVGMQDLVIPDLGNATIHYDVKETVLTATPEETVEPLINNFNTFSATVGTSAGSDVPLSAISSFNDIFSHATPAEKTQIAIMYKANKMLFDDILLHDYSTMTGRFIGPSDIADLAKHSYAVYIMAAGALVTIYAPEPLEKALGIAVTAAGAYKAYQFFTAIADDKLNTVTLEAGNLMGTNNRLSSAAELTFYNNISGTISFNAVERKLIQGDSNKTQPAAVGFFKTYNKYNYYIGKVNAVINWVNQNVLFANFSLVPLEQLPSASPQSELPVSAANFSNVSLSVDHPNVSLESSSLSADGQLSLKFKVIGNPASVPILTSLKYSFTDAFSEFTGSFPLKINSGMSAVGTWQLESFNNGIPLGQYVNVYSSMCPSIAYQSYTILNETMVITADSYSYTGAEIYKNFNVAINTTDCTITSNGADTQQNFPISGGGTYVLNGDTFTGTEDGVSASETFTFITANKIKIGDRVWNRQ
jgi:hypothetical protein